MIQREHVLRDRLPVDLQLIDEPRRPRRTLLGELQLDDGTLGRGLLPVAVRLEREEQAFTEQIEAINRKRKAEQLKAGPLLAQMEDEWIRAIKKNIEIEAACLEKEGEARSRHT